MLYKKVIERGNVIVTDTGSMSRSEWLKLRTSGIGGSDAGAIMGLNKYATPLSVYLAKKDLAVHEGSQAAEWGNILEEPVRQKAREELGIEIETVPCMFTSKEHNFMNANIDGLVYINGTKEIAGVSVCGLGGREIKTSRSGEGFTTDEIPDSYYAQVEHYMAVTGLLFFILTVFIFSQYTGRHYVIPRNDEFIDNLIERERKFWNDFVLANIMPAPTGNENELDLVKSLPMAEEIMLGEDAEQLIEEKEAIDSQIKELQNKSGIIKEHILLKMAEINNAVKTLKDRRIALEKEWNMPFQEFKNIIAETTAMMEDASGKLDVIVKNEERKEKEEKHCKIVQMWETKGFNLVTLDRIFNTKWLNKTCKLANIDVELDGIISLIKGDIASLEVFGEDSEVLKSLYLSTLNLQSALNKGAELKANRERLAKLEAEKATEAEPEEEQALVKTGTQPEEPTEKTYLFNVSGIRSVIDNVINIAKTIGLSTIPSLTMEGTVEQITQFKEHLAQHNIGYDKAGIINLAVKQIEQID